MFLQEVVEPGFVLLGKRSILANLFWCTTVGEEEHLPFKGFDLAVQGGRSFLMLLPYILAMLLAHLEHGVHDRLGVVPSPLPCSAWLVVRCAWSRLSRCLRALSTWLFGSSVRRNKLVEGFPDLGDVLPPILVLFDGIPNTHPCVVVQEGTLISLDAVLLEDVVEPAIALVYKRGL